jgi:hypothetical protein
MFQVSAMAAYFKAISILVKGLQGKNGASNIFLNSVRCSQPGAILCQQSKRFEWSEHSRSNT